jgi:hypothetical protein
MTDGDVNILSLSWFFTDHLTEDSTYRHLTEEMAPTRTSQAIRALATAAILAGVQDPLTELVLAKRDAREDLRPNPTQQYVERRLDRGELMGRVTLIVAACYIVVIGICEFRSVRRNGS